MSMTEADPLGNLTTSYTYDALERLITASNSQTTLHYVYDAAGNRCSTGTSCDGTWTYNAANELTASPGVSSYGYDANGNLTSSSTGGSFTYNSQNQTTRATWNTHTLSGMSYADVGQSERTAAGSTTYASSPFGIQISSTGGSNTYVVRDGKGGLLGQRLPDSSHWYFLKDGLGSIVAVISGSGATIANRYGYDPYGKLTASSGTQANPWGYAGGLVDSTGLVKFGARYYDPNLGRWTQQDSITGSITNPSSTDRYVYVSDDPTNGTDRTGLFNFGTFFGAAVGTLVGVGICVAFGLETAGVACVVAIGVAMSVGTGVGDYLAGDTVQGAVLEGLGAAILYFLTAGTVGWAAAYVG
jgi:RHS repeat-associated protein